MEVSPFNLGRKKIFYVRPVRLPVKSIGNRLFVGLLGERLSDVVQVCFFVDHTLQEMEVLLKGAVGDPFVDVFEYFLDLLVHLGKVHIDFVNVALGLKHAGQFLDGDLVAYGVLQVLLCHSVLE